MPHAYALLLFVTLAVQQHAAAQKAGDSPQRAQPVRPAPPASSAAQPPSRFTPFTLASTAFDTNINHNQEDLDAYGMTLGAGVLFRNDPRKPTLELQYQAGFHRYANTNQWDRLSHFARAAWERRLSRRVAFEAVGEGSIKGSTEDRELSNQLSLSPRIEYRITSAWRVRAFGAWRLKRYPDGADRNATNRYGGLELARRGPGIRWSTGGRYEVNAAESSRQRYLRWTWFGDLSTPIGRWNRLEVEMRYRRQRYPFRLVDVKGGPDVPRFDVRIEPEITWVHLIDADLEVRAGYAFSGRDSNDPRRDYRSHQVIASVLQRW
ncbi:MAG: hypothetical protein JJE40_04720 [Vicinamibacteria bacterium]|nr:hypothetical protein [Vicinamibacteria bacterium]